MRFADMEDSAMLGSNMSAISDLREAVHYVLPFSMFSDCGAVLPLRKQKR